MNKQRDSLPLLNAAVAFVILIPVLLLAISFKFAGSGPPPPPPPANDQPPIIVLRETDGYYFSSGSADLSTDFQEKLARVVAPRLQQVLKKYDCDLIEVIGHTDSQPVVATSKSNLDKELLPTLHGQSNSLLPGSNADLGLMRAWSVILVLREHAAWPGIHFFGYSAAQTIDVNGNVTAAGAPSIDPSRRRIEVRVRRSPSGTKP
jgi:outer membrane protein OmpA-like peptidoglycan-associated protein